MQVTCTVCQKLLGVPDNAAGKQVRCPLCQGIFVCTAPEPPAPITPVPAAPPPPPFAVQSAITPAPVSVPAPSPASPAPTPLSVEWESEQQAQESESAPTISRPAALSNGSTWLLAAGLLFAIVPVSDLQASFMIIGKMRIPPEEVSRGIDQQVRTLLLFFTVPIALVLLGGLMMRLGRAKGLVITGIVFNFILCILMIFRIVFGAYGALSGNPVVFYPSLIQITIATVALLVGVLAGLRVSNLLTKPDIRAAFHRDTDPDLREDFSQE